MDALKQIVLLITCDDSNLAKKECENQDGIFGEKHFTNLVWYIFVMVNARVYSNYG